MNQERRLLVAVWLVLGALVTCLTSWHPTEATSPDSVVYLRIAADWRTYDGTFPPVYALLIGLIAQLTPISLLWTSKLVNWLALGVFGWLWSGRVGAKRATGLLAIWLLPGNLRVATYTWSETVFVVLLLEMVWLQHRWQIDPLRRSKIRLASLLTALVWTRYAGLFMLLRRPFLGYALPGIVLLFVLHYALNGQFVGGPRFIPTEPWPELVRMAGRAVANELLLVNYQEDKVNLFFGLSAFGQSVGVGLLIRRFHRKGIRLARFSCQDPLVREMVRTGLRYFLTLFVLRTFSPFDPLTERLMLPGSLCWTVAWVLWVQSQHSMMSKSPERAEIRTNPSSATSLLVPER